MSALVVLAAVGVWLYLGYLIWRLAVARLIKNGATRAALGVTLAVLWLAAPWVDEWLGAREFKRLCDEMPEVKFYGPVAVGPGPFYNEDGSPKWQTKQQFYEISHPLWGTLFSDKEQLDKVRSLPVTVFERRIVRRYQPTGQVVEVFIERLSPGGWIKRATGWASHAPYQCPWKSYVVREDRDYITFSK